MNRLRWTFLALVGAQAAHVLEEYAGRLWEVFAPARVVTTAVSASNPEASFIGINAAFLAFGVWCLLWPVRRGWPSARGFVWAWVFVEMLNGIVHPAWSASQGAYTPGVVTSVLLLGLASYLAYQLVSEPRLTG